MAKKEEKGKDFAVPKDLEKDLALVSIPEVLATMPPPPALYEGECVLGEIPELSMKLFCLQYQIACTTGAGGKFGLARQTYMDSLIHFIPASDGRYTRPALRKDGKFVLVDTQPDTSQSSQRTEIVLAQIGKTPKGVKSLCS
jgi:hypothetical protein